MTIRKRAIQDGQKAERRDIILSKAAKLIAKKDFHAITVAEIAKEAGIAKGTVFLYFKTKEEIFLQLQSVYYELWFSDIDSRLMELLALKRELRISEFAELTISTLKKQPLLFRLIPILHVIIEQNIDREKAVEFKRLLHSKLTNTSKLVEECLPFLKKGEGVFLLLNVQSLIIGTTNLTETAPSIKKLMKDRGMEMFVLEFSDVFKESLTKLITGMKYAHLEK
jgi:AcrR family transcriptional regulator